MKQQTVSSSATAVHTETASNSQSTTSNSAQAASVSAPTSFPTGTSLRYGSTGPLVSLLQQKLTETGFPVPSTGNYLAKTTQAVKDYQTQNGLKADGWAGPMTLARLMGGSTSSSTSNSSGSTRSTSSLDAYKAKAQVAIRAAQSQLGVPYRYATAVPGKYFDCSGLTMYAWQQAGVHLTHWSVGQYNETTRTQRADILPGDLLFFHTPISHVGLYIGSGQMIQAPQTGDVVKVSSVKWGNAVGIGRPK